MLLSMKVDETGMNLVFYRKGALCMSDDISTQFTKEKNNKRGRHGVGGWKYEKVTQISPKDYGMFIQGKRKKKK